MIQVYGHIGARTQDVQLDTDTELAQPNLVSIILKQDGNEAKKQKTLYLILREDGGAADMARGDFKDVWMEVECVGESLDRMSYLPTSKSVYNEENSVRRTGFSISYRRED